MIKKTYTYTDFNGVERTEDFYFHLTEAELTEWELTVDGGLHALLEKIMNSQDNKKLINIFKELITRSYGVKSEDGRRFIKNQDVLDEFMQTQAFSDLYMELALDDKAASEFINGILPANLEKKVSERLKAEEKKVEQLETESADTK